MFALLGQIVKLQTNDLKPVSVANFAPYACIHYRYRIIINVCLYLLIQLPTRLDKDKLKEFAQLEHRHKVFRQLIFLPFAILMHPRLLNVH